jgi:hypothetical protein
LNTYIVTSKPKRISVYSGFVHMAKAPLEVRFRIAHRGRSFHDHGAILIQVTLRPQRKTLKQD